MPANPFFSSGSARVRTSDVHIRTGIVIPSGNTLSERSPDRYAAEVSTSFNPNSSKERTSGGFSAADVNRFLRAACRIETTRRVIVSSGARFEEHLAACPGCRREIAELQNTVTAVAGLTPPSVPETWTAAAKDRLRARRSSLSSPSPGRLAPARRRTNVFQYGLIAAGVTAAVVILLWLVMGGTVQRWLPGLSTAALGVSDPRAARTVNLVALILSLHALLFVPSIIDNIYQLVRRGGRRTHPGSSAGFFVC